MRYGTQPSTDIEFKSPFLHAVYRLQGSHRTHVVHVGQAAGLVPASGEGDLELPAEVLRVRMSHQKRGTGQRIGRRVEGLGPAHTGHRACGDISHRIAAGLARGDSHGGQSIHEVRRVVDVDIVELDVLARGHVQDVVGVLLRELSKEVHLLCRDASERDLNAHHAGRVPHRFRPLCQLPAGEFQLPGARAVDSLAVVVSLTVDTTPKPGLGEDGVFELALALQFDLGLEYLYLPAQILRDPVRELLLPGGGFCHGGLPRS